MTSSLLLLLTLYVVMTSLSSTDCTVLRGVPDEQRLLAKIYRNYDNVVRPVYNATHAVTVKFGMTLIQIIDLVSTVYLIYNSFSYCSYIVLSLIAFFI